FGPNAVVTIGGVVADTYVGAGSLYAVVPDGLPNGMHPVVVTNPEGCRTQAAVQFQVRPPKSCGLIGIEAFALVGFAGFLRRRARARRACSAGGRAASRAPPARPSPAFAPAHRRPAFRPSWPLPGPPSRARARAGPRRRP